MKWFKHFSTAMDDLFIRDLEGKFGDAGYAFWFKTLELIGAHGNAGALTISWTNYCEKLGKRRDHLRRMLTFSSQATHLEFTEHSPEVITIYCAKFAEYSDNFTKYGKRNQSDFKVPLKQEEEVEVDKKKKEICTRPTSEDARAYFQELSLTDGEADKFFDFYSTNGWVQGARGKPIKDWKAAARNWKRNQENFKPKNGDRATLNYVQPTSRTHCGVCNQMIPDHRFLDHAAECKTKQVTE